MTRGREAIHSVATSPAPGPAGPTRPGPTRCLRCAAISLALPLPAVGHARAVLQPLRAHASRPRSAPIATHGANRGRASDSNAWLARAVCGWVRGRAGALAGADPAAARWRHMAKSA